VTRSGLYIASRIEEAVDHEFESIVRRLLAEEFGTITASGVYGLSLEKMMIDTLGESLEAEDNKVLMVQDAHTPDFTAHDFRADITNEVSGTGYTAGGNALTSTEITLASGLLTFDGADVDWPASTITDAMAAVFYTNVGAAGTDQLISLSDFVTSASSVAGLFRVQWHANGIITIDYTP
jgi:hypothetical protein